MSSSCEPWRYLYTMTTKCSSSHGIATHSPSIHRVMRCMSGLISPWTHHLRRFVRFARLRVCPGMCPHPIRCSSARMKWGSSFLAKQQEIAIRERWIGTFLGLRMSWTTYSDLNVMISLFAWVLGKCFGCWLITARQVEIHLILNEIITFIRLDLPHVRHFDQFFHWWVILGYILIHIIKVFVSLAVIAKQPVVIFILHLTINEQVAYKNFLCYNSEN